MTADKPTVIPENYTELAVALGRIEEKVSGLTSLEERLREVETTVTKLEARQAPRVSMWTIVSAVLAVPASLGALVAVIILFTQQ